MLKSILSNKNTFSIFNKKQVHTIHVSFERQFHSLSAKKQTSMIPMNIKWINTHSPFSCSQSDDMFL